jgi:hypothetical protein
MKPTLDCKAGRRLAPVSLLCRIRLHHIWGNHWWITKVTGSIFESLNRKEHALVMTRNETARVLRMIRRQCPNAVAEAA